MPNMYKSHHKSKIVHEKKIDVFSCVYLYTKFSAFSNALCIIIHVQIVTLRFMAVLHIDFA